MRLFLALDIPEEQKRVISDFMRNMAREGCGVKWVEEQNLHLTLKFLGEVPEAALKNINRAVENSLGNRDRFGLTMEGVGYFPNRRDPRVIWIGVVRGQQEMIKIGSQLDAELAELGFDPENNRRAHLTVGRVKDKTAIRPLIESIDKKQERLAPYSFTVEEVVLYQSQLSSKGPTYTKLKSFTLGSGCSK